MKGERGEMAENYKHLYEQTKKMLTMYQDELIPGFRKQIKELEAKSKWIPVTERLPETTCRNMVTKYGIPFLAYYTGKEWRESGTLSVLDGITHWMPLPEPPKD